MQTVPAKASSVVIVAAALTLTAALRHFFPLPSSPEKLGLFVVILLGIWVFAGAAVSCLSTRPLPVLLLDYSCFLPDLEHRGSLEVCEYFGLHSGLFSDESADFMRHIYRKSGLGEETYAPPYFFQPDQRARFEFALVEADQGLFSAVESLLAKTSVPPERISAVVAACSMFSPAPSLSSRLVNRFRGFPADVKTFNLSGMGCSAGTVAIDLAARLLRTTPGGYVLIVVTEATGLSWYYGDNRHMLVTNCIFRVGSAAALLTNDPTARHVAKFELKKTLRTHHGADDSAYNSAIQADDGVGGIGVALTKDLVRVAGASLRAHISTLAPRVLPISELLRYAWRVAQSAVRREWKASAAQVPDFTAAFEHICIHSGGKAIIDAVSRVMGFDERVVEPARMCLHRFGNTSSSLVFYELSYFEAKGRVRAGDRLWMLAFGTGFKACSVVLRALRDVNMGSDSPWRNCIHRYPVKVGRIDAIPK